LGRIFVESLRKDNKKILARSDVIAGQIRTARLEIVPLRYPHPRHSNITLWPSEQAERKLIALEIADQANLVLHN